MRANMKINREYLILGIVIFLIILLGLFELTKKPASQPVGQSPPISENDTEVKTNEAGNVTVTVRFLQDKSTTGFTTFQIVLDTHSVDLDPFDFQKNIYIEKNNLRESPINTIPSGNQHHRQAEVEFKKVSPPYSLVVADLSGIDKRLFTF